MALFIQMNARRFLGSFQEMTSYTDALSVITTLTTSSPWYCIAAFWWCLVLHLLKNHVPLDYPFSCIAGRTHTISVYTGLHTLPLILLAEHRWCSLARNPKSVSFLIWYYCQPVPGNTVTPHSLLWLLTRGADLGDTVFLLRKWSTFIYPAAAYRWKRPKQTVTQHAEHCWDILPVWDACPETQIYKGGFLPPFLLHSPSTPNYASYPYKHFRRKTF